MASFLVYVLPQSLDLPRAFVHLVVWHVNGSEYVGLGLILLGIATLDFTDLGSRQWASCQFTAHNVRWLVELESRIAGDLVSQIVLLDLLRLLILLVVDVLLN